MNDQFLQTLSTYPMCANDFSHGVKRMPATQAMHMKHIECNNSWERQFLAFDIDRHGAVTAAEDAELPEPTFCMENPKNGHAHLLYQLNTPVILGTNARKAPQRFFDDVLAGMTIQLASDPAYAATFVKTPGHPAWITSGTRQKFELSELKESLTVSVNESKAIIRQVRSATVDGSRTLTLFNLLRQWACSQVEKFKAGDYGTFDAAIFVKAEQLSNRELAIALPGTPLLSIHEYKHVATSVSRWAWYRYTGRMTDEQFSKLQQRRVQRRWGDSTELKVKAIELKASSRISNVALAKQLGISRNTLSRWLKEGI